MIWNKTQDFFFFNLWFGNTQQINNQKSLCTPELCRCDPFLFLTNNIITSALSVDFVHKNKKKKKKAAADEENSVCVWSCSHLAFSSSPAVERQSDTSLPSAASEDGFNPPNTSSDYFRLNERRWARAPVYKRELYRGDTWSQRQFILEST